MAIVDMGLGRWVRLGREDVKEDAVLDSKAACFSICGKLGTDPFGEAKSSAWVVGAENVLKWLLKTKVHGHSYHNQGGPQAQSQGERWHAAGKQCFVTLSSSGWKRFAVMRMQERSFLISMTLGQCLIDTDKVGRQSGTT